MSTHKYFDKICCVVLALTLLLTVVFMNADAFGIKASSKVKGYETRLFDTSRVHTVNIVMDDWEGFLANCTNEEYVSCAVVIDNESHKNVAIRAKGNTSLTNVKNYGNDRYSFKIEFDHYDSTKSYHGLDKLSLNNIIQDNTYIKDYLCYTMMGYFGVDAPLCSFVQISVNGEEWGLYLAVEGVEDAFLERNYGKSYGNLYKPDSQSMGGGRGNGGKFNMDDWDSDENSQNADSEQRAENGATPPDGMSPDGKNMQKPDFTEAPNGGQGGMGQPAAEFNVTIEDVKTLLNQMSDEKISEIAEALGYTDASALFAALNKAETLEEFLNGKALTQISELFMAQGNMGGFPGGDKNSGAPGGDMGGGMGSDDVKLIYTDDNYSSYSDIFENAKTDISDDDRNRLISSLKDLNRNSNIEEVVNIEEVIRYFTVHNFVCNFDSYTGSMIHNYYLYEEDGKLSMIPWDYNLAFGGFVGGTDATSMVNFPIDSPVSGGTVDSRPMLAWIFNNEEYTQMYHQYFNEFIENYFNSGYFTEMIDSLKEMISPYVQSDPTKFCTYEEFVTGIDTLKEFCLLRAESINGQLNGTIPSTSDGQSKDSSALISASELNISDMGSMNNSMGAGPDRQDGANGQNTKPDFNQSDNSLTGQDGENKPLQNSDNGNIPQNESDKDSQKTQMQNQPFGGKPSNDGTEQSGNPPDASGDENRNFEPPDSASSPAGELNTTALILFGCSILVLAIGLIFALFYKKRV